MDNICIFCDELIDQIDSTHTEDGELSHKICLERFNRHWDDRNEILDLIGY
jgi:hypothetical protein